MYTGSEGEVSGKCCVFTELLHCGASAGETLYKTRTVLLKPAVGHPFVDKVETSVGLGSIWECFKIFLETKWIVPHTALFHISCPALLLAAVRGGFASGDASSVDDY